MSDWAAKIRELNAKTAANPKTIPAPAQVSNPALAQKASVAPIPNPPQKGATLAPIAPPKIAPKPFAIKTNGAAPPKPSAFKITKPVAPSKPVLENLVAEPEAVAEAERPSAQPNPTQNIAQVNLTLDAGIPQAQTSTVGDSAQPERYTPAEISDLKNALMLLESGIKNPQVVSAAVKNVLTSISNNPNLCDILAPEDCGLMVRGLRESYGIVIAKKDEKVSKRAEKDADADDILAGLVIAI